MADKAASLPLRTTMLRGDQSFCQLLFHWFLSVVFVQTCWLCSSWPPYAQQKRSRVAEGIAQTPPCTLSCWKYERMESMNQDNRCVWMVVCACWVQHENDDEFVAFSLQVQVSCGSPADLLVPLALGDTEQDYRLFDPTGRPLRT